jgi:integrase/recombinase XerC
MDGADRQAGLGRALPGPAATQRQLSPHTVQAYRRDLQELAALLARPAWAAVVHADIRRLAATLHAQSLHRPRSIARKLSSWRGFFDWLAQPPASWRPTRWKAVRAPEARQILAQGAVGGRRGAPGGAPATPRGEPEPFELCNRAMFELLYSSGLRVSELAGLDLAWPGGRRRPPPSLGWIDLDAAEVIVTGKGGKMRKVPVGRHALDALAAWLAVRPPPRDGGAALFLSARASRITPRVVQLRLKAHAARSGTLVNVHPHVLRHSFASHVLQSSGDLRAVQDMLGHASIASTQVYTALDFQHLAAVYDKAHPRADPSKASSRA